MYMQFALIDGPQYENAVSVLHRELAGFESSDHKPNIKIQPILIEFGNVK